jgi:UDP-3-O-[3-hydroxymyristoyl] glucosamine N-acyltransferase
MKASEIAKEVGGAIHGDPETNVSGVAALFDATPECLAFTVTDSDVETSAGCLIVPENAEISRYSSTTTIISVKNPKLAFAKAASLLLKRDSTVGIASSSSVSAEAILGSEVGVGHGTFIDALTKVGDGTSIGHGCVIGKRVVIGRRCHIGAKVVIGDDCVIGDDAVIHAGVVIGADGLGFVQDVDGTHLKFPQIGKVIIGSNVEIGANTCIDRGSLGDTEIGDGTKIDNLVQIAHNVKIGRRVMLAAQVGIAGSSIIGDDCVLAGQVGIADHVELKPGTAVGGKSLVNSGKILRGGVWWGFPVMPISEAKKVLAESRNLGGLGRTLKLILKEIEDLKSRIN